MGKITSSEAEGIEEGEEVTDPEAAIIPIMAVEAITEITTLKGGIFSRRRAVEVEFLERVTGKRPR